MFKFLAIINTLYRDWWKVVFNQNRFEVEHCKAAPIIGVATRKSTCELLQMH